MLLEKKENNSEFSYESMGTTWKISIYEIVEETFFESLQKEIIDMSQHFDETYSRFIKTSLIWKIAEKAGVYEVPQDFMNMLRMYIELYLPSGKKLNPLIGFTISDLGYDADYTLIPKSEIRNTPDLLANVRIVDATHIETTQPLLFDFGALGKGYFVDKIASLLKQKGFTHFLVNGSGDIYYAGTEPINVGLEHPDDATQVIGAIEMGEGAMCASGTNRRAWDKYHHVIDPHSNTSTEEIIATWVIAKSAGLADALASCLFFVAPEELSLQTFEYCIMNKERRIKTSKNFTL